MRAERAMVLGVGVDCVDMAGMERAAEQTVDAGTQCSIIAVNPEKIMAASANASLRECLNAAEFLIPDGIGAVLAARAQGFALPERVPGSELMPRLCALAARRGFRVFLFGARQDINDRAALRLRETYPGLIIAGRQHGYVADNAAALIQQINAAQAQLLFVALGSPKQELWIAQHRRDLRVNVIQGVGGTFDVIAGAVRRAPRRWLALNLEWLYRLLANPRRLLRQTALVSFAWRVMWSALRTSDAPRLH